VEAIVWHGRGDVRYQEMPDAPPPGPGEVRVRVAFAGICGTDLEEYLNGPIYIPVRTPHPLTGRQAPLILGHEFSGLVESVGAGVENLAAGDAVACDALVYCHRCVECQRGHFNLCEYLAALGQMADGGLAELVTGPAYSFIKLPPSVSLDHAALAEPLAVAVRGVNRARVSTGDHVLVMGAGAIGLFVVQVARRRGAASVAVVEPQDYRRQLALDLGADIAVPTVDGLGLGSRFDCAVECTGKPTAQVEAISRIRPQGRLVLVGIPTEPTVMNTLLLINAEKEIAGSLSHLAQEDFVAGVELLSQGSVVVEPLISRRLLLREGVRALTMLSRREEDVVKILLQPERAELRGGHEGGKI
jgi:(R,R)-butanediol dehydrogenase/meso-butanediol dehydrogenase/diacetyl reductase